MTNSDRLQEIRERAEAAMKGPWFWYKGYDSIGVPKELPTPDFGPEDGLCAADGTAVVRGSWRNDSLADCCADNPADAELIAASREDIPYLLQLVTEQQREIEGLKEDLKTALRWASQ